MTEKLLAAFLSLLDSAFTGFDESVAAAIAALTTEMTYKNESGVDVNVFGQMVGKAGFLVPFCNVLLAMFFSMELYQVAQKLDMLKWEHVLKLGVKYCFCVSALNMIPDFLWACYRQATTWMGDLKGPDMQMGATALDRLKESHALEQIDSLWSAIGLVIVALIVLLAIKICGLLIQVVAYGRMFELCVYVVASPLPIAFLPLGHGNGEGFSRITLKFLRSFAAVCFQGVLMIVVLSVFDSLIGASIMSLIDAATTPPADGSAAAEATTTITKVLFQMFLAAVALVMSMTKCSSWARNILDAN